MYSRDPLSVMFDAAARRMLARAVSARGQWVATRLADPTDAQRQRLLDWWGIDPSGPDNPSTMRKRGGVNARSRWGRAFVRAVHYHAGRPVQVEVGAHKPRLGVLPPGYAVRVRTRQRNGARAAALRKPESARIFEEDGQPGARWSDPERRDW